MSPPQFDLLLLRLGESGILPDMSSDVHEVFPLEEKLDPKLFSHHFTLPQIFFYTSIGANWLNYYD